jgi:hypothetical protein
MPCFRCAARQSDPVNGPSKWKRGVVGGVQVLICPDCQRAQSWHRELDTCTQCGSTELVRSLGDTRCRPCGAVATEPGGFPPIDPALAADVASALRRRFETRPPPPEL